MKSAAGEPLSAVQMAVIDAALAEELAEFLDLPAELLERYRVQLAAGREGGQEVMRREEARVPETSASQDEGAQK